MSIEIRTATKQEVEMIGQLGPIGGRSKTPIRLRVEAIEDEIVAFDGCCDGTLGLECPTRIKVRSAITNVHRAFPEKKYRQAHMNGVVYVWKVEG